MKTKSIKKMKKFSKPTGKVIKKKKPAINKLNSKTKKLKSKDYSDMNVDEFMDKEIERASDEEDQEISDDKVQNGKQNDENDFEADSGSESEDNDNDNFESHKKSLTKLKELDPEFYKFLEENDKKLLQFNDSDDEVDDEDENDNSAEENDDDDDNLHKPGELEVASDESDFEGDDDTVRDNRVITLKLLKIWQKDIHTDNTLKTIACLTKAFHAALIRVSSDENEIAEYKVDGSSIFNGVVQLCVLELGPALKRYLKISSGSKLQPHKCKRFVKIRTLLRSYFADLLKLLGGVTSTNIRNVLLKHLHYMSSFLTSFTTVTRKILKRVIHLWGTADEQVRVIAFMCILRITNNQQTSYLDMVLKSMYMTYVKNCKFMSKGTLPGINFMRRSLTEMFALDVNISYKHVFLYIRQLAIHLRSAVTLHKKENIQAVYNWQFVNSMHLWSNLLSVTCNKQQLQPLIYPLVQIAIGTIKLMPTAQYFPLRFHCLQILTDLSRDTGIFIPILPFLLEVLTNFDFNKKHKKVSMKPLEFTCLLRLSKSQMMENGFKDTIIDTVYGLLLEYLANQSYSISFPDVTLFCVVQMKQFLKKCSVSNYTKKLRQLLEKIEQNSKFIENERKKVTFNINDFKQIDAWEIQIKIKETPLSQFFDTWNKFRTIKKRKQVTDNDKLGDYNLPQLKKIIKKPVEPKANNGPVELFPSDSESDNDIGFKDKNDKEELKQKKVKKQSKKSKKEEKVTEINNEEMLDEDNTEKDVVQDIKLSDW